MAQKEILYNKPRHNCRGIVDNIVVKRRVRKLILGILLTTATTTPTTCLLRVLLHYNCIRYVKYLLVWSMATQRM